MQVALTKPEFMPVTVIRYIRSYTEDGSWTNLGGITLVFTMDYNDRAVGVQFAICSSKDNFNKADGLKHALASPSRAFDLDKFRAYADLSGGFVRAYIAILLADTVTGVVSPNEKLLLKKMKAQSLTV